ncbi:MAG: hypothetical protein JW727_04455 [Candidatus Aenigmarchaeota archaeon]|nr:hypothetical protein [Candidatus Aenigmarchaeota archaeon]
MASLLQHFERAFSAYRKNLIPYTFSALLVCFAAVFVMFLGMLVFVLNSESVFYSEEFMNQAELDPAVVLLALMTPGNIAILFTFSFLALVAFLYMSAGVYGVCLEGLRGRVSVRAFFSSVARRGGSYLIASLILLGFLMGFIVLAMFVPIFLFVSMPVAAAVQSYLVWFLLIYFLGFLLTPFFFSVLPAIVSGRGIINAFRESMAVGRDNYLELLLLEVLLFTGFFVSALIPYIWAGILFFISVPIATFVNCSFYLDRVSPAKMGAHKESPKQPSGQRRIPARVMPARAAAENQRPAKESEFIEEPPVDFTVSESKKKLVSELRERAISEDRKKQGQKKKQVSAATARKKKKDTLKTKSAKKPKLKKPIVKKKPAEKKQKKKVPVKEARAKKAGPATKETAAEPAAIAPIPSAPSKAPLKKKPVKKVKTPAARHSIVQRAIAKHTTAKNRDIELFQQLELPKNKPKKGK